MKWLYHRSLLHNPSSPQLAIHSNDYIGASINVHGVFEKEYIDCLHRLFDELRIHRGVLIDCGANIGNHAVHLGLPFHQVIAIEPHPRNYGLLALNCRGEKYRLLQVAASSGPGEMTLAGFASNMGATKIIPTAAAASTSSDNDAMTLSVRVEPLDNLVEAGTAVDVIKIDVEGHELQVLQGASRILSQLPLVIFEQLAWETRDAAETAATYLEKLGYQFITLKANDPLEPASRLKKLSLLAHSILLGPRIEAALRKSVSKAETFPCILALHPQKFPVNEGLLSCLHPARSQKQADRGLSSPA
jgi:FkbM family methyltransferase